MNMFGAKLHTCRLVTPWCHNGCLFVLHCFQCHFCSMQIRSFYSSQSRELSLNAYVMACFPFLNSLQHEFQFELFRFTNNVDKAGSLLQICLSVCPVLCLVVSGVPVDFLINEMHSAFCSRAQNILVDDF